MRPIRIGSTLTFAFLFSVAVLLGIATTAGLSGYLPPGDFRGIVLIFLGILAVYLYSIIIYRIFFGCFPFREGFIEERSFQEYLYQTNQLFFLLLFNPFVCTRILPVPLMRVVYLMLGARLGKGTYSGGTILDPLLTEIGSNSIVGQNAILFSHVIEGKKLALKKIRIGSNVTIGAQAVIMSGVTIGDDATVAVGAVVPKDTKIGPGETWAGVPARKR